MRTIDTCELGMFRSLLTRDNRTIRYVSDSAYWLYLAHLPLVLGTQVIVRDWPLPALVKSRTRLSAAAWLVVRDTHAAEDIFQNVALKSMTREVSFESEGALISWAFITARHEGIDWLRRHRREALGLDEDILELLEQEWQAAPAHPAGAKIDALRECLAAAPQSARLLLKLRYFEGYSCDEAAQRDRLERLFLHGRTVGRVGSGGLPDSRGGRGGAALWSPGIVRVGPGKPRAQP